MLRFLAVTVLIGMCLGCGSEGGGDRAAVEGKVTFDGTPVEDGAINFAPAAGTKGPSTGGQIKGGRYSLPAAAGPFVGRHRVEIHAPRPTGKKIANPYKQGETVDELKDAVPARYNTASTLRGEVKPGRNTIDFELTTH